MIHERSENDLQAGKNLQMPQLHGIIRTRGCVALQWHAIKLGELRAQHIKHKVTQIGTKHLTYLGTFLSFK